MGTNMISIDPKIIEDFIETLIEDGDVEFTQIEDQVGMIGSIGDLLSFQTETGIRRVFIQFFAKQWLPDIPTNKELGYTEDDVMNSTGVVVAEVHPDHTNPPNYIGEVVELKEFIDEYLVNGELIELLNEMVDTLHEGTDIPEEWIEEAGRLFNERIPGNDSFLMEQKKVC